MVEEIGYSLKLIAQEDCAFFVVITLFLRIGKMQALLGPCAALIGKRFLKVDDLPAQIKLQ